MDRKIRDSLNFEGTPIKIIYRGKSLREVGRSSKQGDPSTSQYNRNNNKMGSPMGMKPVGKKWKKIQTSAAAIYTDYVTNVNVIYYYILYTIYYYKLQTTNM